MSNNKKSEGTFTPKLRFPEFRNAPEWERKKLSELLFETKQRNRNLKYSPKDVLSVSGEYGVVNQIDLLGRSYAGVSVKDYHIVETGDIVYTKSPLKKNPFGIIKENKGKPGIVSTLYAVYRATDKAYSTYLDHYFSRDYNLNSYLQPIVRKGAKNDMKVNNFAVLGGEILIPRVDEQQKIADCLTSLDELIAAERAQLDALKDYKKGLLQNLFPAEGETVPALRFPEFQSAGEWEEKTLGELGDVLMCKRIFAEETNDREGVPFFKIGTLGSKPDAFISKDLFDEYKAKYNFPRKGEILITCSGTVGKCLAYDGNDAYYQDSNIVWIDNPTLEISNEFLYSILLNVDWGELNSTTITRIYTSDLRSLSIVFPTNKKEQEKIAELLTSIDEAIAAQGQRVAALGVHKQGLLQGLFP